MKDINLGKVLVEQRRRMGITQDELASYLGVSKAAVSKWETGATYPDITLLPQLAAFFNIRIDELLDYQPQMTAADSRRLYARLSGEFSVLPFERALDNCRKYIRKYYSCFPLLFHLGSLLVNHCTLSGSQETKEELLREASGLFRRIRTYTDDVQLGREALQMEAYCFLALKKPEEVLSLLGGESLYSSRMEPLRASAYEMTGHREKARETLQVGIFQSLLALLEMLSSYLRLCIPDREAFDKTVQRITDTASAFDAEKLHPGILLSCYLSIAQNYVFLDQPDSAMEYLRLYTDLACGDIYPLHLHGDAYFDLLDKWICKNLYLGDSLPRDEALIRHSMTQALSENPAFTVLSGRLQFLELVRRLKTNEEEQSHDGG